MSLYFNERFDDQIEDPTNDNIRFTYPWIITINKSEWLSFFFKKFRTSHQYMTESWTLKLSGDGIALSGDQAWNGSSSFISYNLYYDNDMRFLLHSSSRIEMEDVDDYSFRAPDGFIAKIVDAVDHGKISKIVVFVELHLPLKCFYRPFDNPAFVLCEDACDKYPENMENNFKFMFLKMSDYSIKCRDGSIPALKILLNSTSAFMEEHFKKSDDYEYIVEYSIDVVKPIIYYLHSKCFEMPPTYDLEYIHRLFTVIELFQPVHLNSLREAVQLSLGRKFCEENINNFDSLLPWLSIANNYGFPALTRMISTIIASKYYFKWHEIFPENAQNTDNPIYRDVFGDDADDFVHTIFRNIEENFINSLLTNVILP